MKNSSSTLQLNIQLQTYNLKHFYYIYLYNSCPSHDNILDSSTDPSQVLGIECDAPTATEQTTYQRITYVLTTDTPSNDSVAIATYLHTTDTLQSTTMRPKEDTLVNDRITGNIIGINVVNSDDIILCVC